MFSDVVKQLRQIIAQPFPDVPGFQTFTLSVPATRNLSLPDWLSRQSVYPQFYWQDRSKTEEVAVCGAPVVFQSIEQGQHFLQQQKASRLWGMNAFDKIESDDGSVQEGFLFLPRIECLIEDETLHVTFNLFSAKSLAQDVREAYRFLARLETDSFKTSSPISQRVMSEVQLPDYSEWELLIERALVAIRQQKFEKVVLARRTSLTLDSPISPALLLSESRDSNKNCFHFMLSIDSQRAFLGSSPERLYKRNGTVLLTEALAGTVVSSADEAMACKLAEWLLQDDKNQRENLLVVDDICQRMRHFAGDIDVESAEVVRLRRVQHLRRVIRARLVNTSDAECLHWLQPTAAVAGLPREEAKNFILQNEPFQREWYAGSAGYLSLPKAEFCVALRSAYIKNDTLHLYAGAGIVAGSDPHQEWLEINNKAASLRTLLNGSNDR